MRGGALCGIFGGAFDPVHRGHIEPVMQVAKAAALAGVRYIPAARPPHRARPHAPPHARLQMIRIALAAGKNFTADDIELRRRGISYSIDTVRALREQHPGARYALLLGMDAFLHFETWRDWRDLLRRVHIIVMTRPGFRAPNRPAWWRDAQVESADALHGDGGNILQVETTPLDISSTKVRAKINAGGDPGAMLPRGVWEYIRAHHLYGAQK